MPEVNSENILTYLQLTSDVKGFIEQPNYYFDKANPNSLVHLDILLMTQGWRRFTWSEVLTPTFKEPQYPIETGITLSGSALQLNDKPAPKPVEVSIVYHPTKDQTEVLQAKTDAKGKFVFTNLNLNGEVQAMVQGRKEKGGKDVLLKLDQPESPAFKPTKNQIDPFLFLDFKRERASEEKLKHYIELQSKTKSTKVTELKEVVVTPKVIKEDTRKSLYASINHTTLKVDPIHCATALSVYQLLQGRVPGLTIMYTGKIGAPIGIQFRSYDNFYGNRPQPIYLLDGFSVDWTVLENIPPCSVESIDVIASPITIYNAFGMISVLTKDANPNLDWTGEPARGIIRAKIRGYNMSKEFYSPKYTADLASGSNPDFRTTIYWNPNVRTDANGNTEVSFWNTGESTTVNVRLEGISQDGEPAFATYEYKVK
jgi:hypothetical protein